MAFADDSMGTLLSRVRFFRISLASSPSADDAESCTTSWTSTLTKRETLARERFVPTARVGRWWRPLGVALLDGGGDVGGGGDALAHALRVPAKRCARPRRLGGPGPQPPPLGPANG